MTGNGKGAPSSPLKHGYLVRNPLLNAWLRISDAILRARIRGSAAVEHNAPSSVLVSISGHRGDAIVATAFLHHLRAALPNARIGVLTGSSNRHIFEGDARIHALHFAHHWRLDRSGAGLLARWRRARASRAAALREIRGRYDAAVELSPHYPSDASLFRRAGIPRRVGYATGGGGPFLTHTVPWVEGRHMGEDHLALLPSVIARARTDARLDGYDLAPMSAEAVARARAAQTRFGISSPYVVIHAGSGSAKRIWPADHWRAVARALGADGVQVVLSGFGGEEAALNREIGAGMHGVVDLTDRVNWDESRGIFANAAAILCANTVAMHLAGADNVPAVVVMDGTEPTGRWRPPGSHVRVLSQPVPCSPCYLSRGCAAMTCLRGVTPDQVLAAVRANVKTAGAAAVPARL